MYSFQREVRGYQDCMTGRRPQHGAVVSDAGCDRAFSRLGSAANACNQLFFRQRHGDQYIEFGARSRNGRLQLANPRTAPAVSGQWADARLARPVARLYPSLWPIWTTRPW
jgi:hypothetical protein